MGKEIYKLCLGKADSFTEIASAFPKKLEATVIEAVGYEVGPMQTILYVFERHFFRTESMASLTVLFTNDGQQIFADIIASGAGQGVFNISWGANGSFARMAVDILQQQGFQVLAQKDSP
ncbi:hypothetical protein EII38_00360 [Streptococcus minor]|uniref:Uncharacterized protein n=2 Tax=Streptococcus minor TaxID=229549 RepID=A0A3P1VDB0_9STRE|nr:hypothetical protein EII38_00360 [Streptococcus minor]